MGIFLFLALALVWLNGPGLRWIAPRVASHFLEKAGLRGHFKVEGTLTGGLSISSLDIEGDKDLATLTIGRITPDYDWAGLRQGKLKGLTVDGVHADLRLGLEKEKPSAREKPPLDLKKLVETIRSVRGQIIPLNLMLKDISLSATQDGKPALSLAPSSLIHVPGSDDLELDLGTFTDATGRVWPAQKSTIVWQPDSLSIQKIDPFPGVGIRDFVLQLPAGGEPSADTRVLVDEAVFVLTTTPGFTSAKIDLREGQLLVAETARRFGVEVPATATLTSLAIEADQILPDPKAATGNVRVLLENIAWQDWASPEFSLDATLGDARANVAARGMILGTEVSLDAEAPVTRLPDRFSLGDAEGKFAVADVPALLRDLAPRVPAIDPAVPVPASSVEGNFKIGLAENKPQSALAEINLKPADPELATPLAIKARWAPDEPVSADVAVDGLKVSASYGIPDSVYQGNLTLEDFNSSRLDRWLAIVKVKPGGTASVTGNWNGSGDLKAGTHKGDLSLSQANWAREAAPLITAIGGVNYDWPARFETKGLRVQMADQTVAVEAALGDGLLELRQFVWSNGADELAEGRATLPVPADFSQWRDTLANDKRTIDVSIDSRVLSFGLLKQWVPAFEKLDPRSTGQVGIDVSGTYGEPVVQMKFEARDLRSPAQPKLPPADLKLELSGSEGRLNVTGEAIAPDFAPAVLKASMPFRPADWANAPEIIKEEPIDARVDLPRLDLSRFTTLVPAADRLGGFLTGNVVVSGKVSKPEVRGSVDLTGGGFRVKGDKFPAIENLSASVDGAMDRVVLKSLKATVAGGTLQGDGAVVITEGKLGDIRLNVRGDHLPLVRNDFLILRANANLTLQGTLERATLSGTVGAVDSIFFRDIEILPIGKPFTGPSAAALPKIDPPKAEASSIPEPFRDWGLNVTVRTEEPLIIRGNLANGEVSGSVRVGGTIGSPAPDGAFNVRDLRASLPFSTLTVRRGTLTFTPASGFDPILEIRGTAEPRPYQVTIYAYGRASNPQLVLTSNPPLPENEIMTLLATGTTTSGLEDPSAASSRALQLLAEELRRGRFRYGKQLRPVLALLDKVDFSLAEADPYSNESFSTATISLTDRWFLSAGMGAEGDSRGLLIWRLSFH